MSARYAWLIVQDHLHDEDPRDTRDEAGTYGPPDAPEELCVRLHNGEGIVFHLIDGDGITYYSGRLLVADPDDLGDEDIMAAPLDDFGRPNAGCTDLHYPRHPEWNIG